MTPEQWQAIEHFKPAEFDSRDAPGTGELMEASFMVKLDKVRAAMGRPLVPGSGYRTIAHNLTVGGKENSAHLRGFAADIVTAGPEDCVRLALYAAFMGIARIGVNLTWRSVHLDTDPSLPTPAVWFYPPKP